MFQPNSSADNPWPRRNSSFASIGPAIFAAAFPATRLYRPIDRFHLRRERVRNPLEVRLKYNPNSTSNHNYRFKNNRKKKTIRNLIQFLTEKKKYSKFILHYIDRHAVFCAQNHLRCSIESRLNICVDALIFIAWRSKIDHLIRQNKEKRTHIDGWRLMRPNCAIFAK